MVSHLYKYTVILGNRFTNSIRILLFGNPLTQKCHTNVQVNTSANRKNSGKIGANRHKELVVKSLVKRSFLQLKDNASFFYNHNNYLKQLKANQSKRSETFTGRAINRILLIRLGSLGDVIRSTAIIQQLKEEFPNATVDVLTSEKNKSVILGNPNIQKVWTVQERNALPAYDWVINLQTPNPPEAFLDGIEDYATLLKEFSTSLQCDFITGRRYLASGEEFIESNACYCHSEFEEFMLSAALTPDPNIIDKTCITFTDEQLNTRQQTLEKFGFHNDRKVMGVYIGGKSFGGHDEGFRSYPMDFVMQVVDRYHDEFQIVIIGQSQDKLDSEIEALNHYLGNRDDVINLIDKTNLTELLFVIQRMDIFVTCDSGPLHMALALNTSTVAAFATGAEFTLGKKTGQNFVAFDLFSPCIKNSLAWKYFCSACEQRKDVFDCPIAKANNKFAGISLDRLDSTIRALIN